MLLTDYFKETITNAGGEVNDLPDNLYSTLCERLITTLDNGGGGGNMLMKLSHTSLHAVSDKQINFNDATVDKTYEEILSAIENGMSVRIGVNADLTTVGFPSDSPNYIEVPFSFKYTHNVNGVILLFTKMLYFGGMEVYVNIPISQNSVQAFVTMT